MNKIPKKIHLIWLGGNIPPKFNFLVNEIKRINYDYEIIEWNEENIKFELINQKLFNETENLGAKSDILRFEILYRYGGIYMDYDFLQIKKFDDLLDNNFFVGIDKNNYVYNSIIGSTKNNQICEKFLNGLNSVLPLKKNEIDRIMNETGPYYLTNIIKNNLWEISPKILTYEYFFPFPGSERHKIREFTKNDLNYVKSFITKNTYCVHLFTTTWQ